MGRLTYTTMTSLDGFVADETGSFSWAAPDAEVHAFVNDLERDTGTYLYGRRMYETMVYWETHPTDDPDGSVQNDYARIWQAADKVVYSSTLDAVSSGSTTLEDVFDPQAVAARVAAARRDVSIGGPHLAAHALRAGIVDEIRMLRVPVIVGGGTPALPHGIRFDLELRDSRTFAGGTTYAAYAVTR